MPGFSVATNDPPVPEWSGEQQERFARSLMRCIHTFRIALQLDDDGELDELLEDTIIALQRAYALAVTLDQAPSVYKERLLLQSLAAERPSFRRVATLPYAVQGRISRHYPGGWIAMNAGCRPKLLKSAIMRAVEELPPTKRGRPPKLIRIAPRQLGLELAEIFRHTGRPPRRRYGETKGEYGPFRDFVAIACEILNSEFVRPSSKRPLFSVATVARYGIDYFRQPISERARSPGSFHQVTIESE